MANKKSYKEIGIFSRIGLFLIGLSIAVFLFIFSFDYETLPFQINAVGYNITTFAFATFVIITGIIAGTLIKSGVLGKYRLD